MIDCTIMEYELCKIFEMIDEEQCKGFWCDGVKLSEQKEHYTKKYVNDNKCVNLIAYIGKTGQTEYSLKLLLGKKALSRYARGLSISECFPTDNVKNFVKLDIENKCIEITLK